MKTTIKRSLEITYQVMKFNNVKVGAEIEKEIEYETDEDIAREIKRISNIVSSTVKQDLEKQCKRYWGEVPKHD